MFFLLSGEGGTDIGSGRSSKGICQNDDFIPGPMALIVAKIVEGKHDYSILEGACGYVSEALLVERARLFKARREMRLPGKRRARETGYFFNNARVLARIANETARELQDEVVAVLFRDADGTASAGRGYWEAKWQSMLDGFEVEQLRKGVPMVPKPKSEAWLLCAWKKHPYRSCEKLENRSGNDRSPKSLKGDLAALFEVAVTPELLCDRIKDHFEVDKMIMPSFTSFRLRLEAVIGASGGNVVNRLRNS